jgi:phosphoribosylformimino-5-aminoimidazole carboxamide ribotide isomerase
MKVFPAIDIIEGKCVRLTKGLADQKTIYENSPVEMAKLYQDTGFKTIHVVDLDSTLGNGNNDKVLKDIRNNVDIKIEVAGGIRSKEAIDNKINEGFDIIVIGTFAIKNINEVLQFDDVILNKLSIALDIKDNQIASHGWQQTATTHLMISLINIIKKIYILSS